MIITVTLHCQGFQGPCSSAITTALRDALGEVPLNYLDGKLNVTVPRILQSATNGQWDIRPITTDKGETWHARCPRCAEALLDWTAQEVQKELAVHRMARASGIPLKVVDGNTKPHTCATPTYSGTADDYRTGESWKCDCGVMWDANREEESWTRSQL